MPPQPAAPREPHVNPGSQAALRESNQQRVFQRLLHSGSLTQAELSRATGLSRASISNIVGAMVENGLAETSPTISSGRRALLVRLSSDGAVAVGVDFGRSHVRIVIATLDYRIVAERSVPLELGHLARRALVVAAALLERMLAEASLARSAVLGVGVGIPGPIDVRTHTVISGTVLPEWIGITVADIEDHFRFPAFIDNDANLGALCEVTWGPHSAVGNLIFIKVGSGIGSGLIVNGAQFTGTLGLGGEIGHIPIHEHGLVCRCGNRGCLETVASTSIMLELLGRTENPSATTSDIVKLGLEGDRATRQVVDDAAYAVGRTAAIVADFFNPHTIVIGGPLIGLGELLLGPIRRGMKRYAMPIIAETTVVTASTFGDRAEALGATALVLRRHGLEQLSA